MPAVTGRTTAIYAQVSTRSASRRSTD